MADLTTGGRQPAMKIWIDLDNTPHVPFFVPIIQELERRGHQVVITARDAFQVCELADRTGLPYVRVGRHYGRSRVRKLLGLLWRSAQLLPFYVRERPDISVSHGSRAQVLLCNALRGPTVLITDYEHAQTIPLGLPKWAIVPDALARSGIERKVRGIKYYRGIKEDVYVPRFKPDPSLLEELGLRIDDMIVLVRPPANEAHYYRPESDELLAELIARLSRTPEARTVLLPRNVHQEAQLRADYPEWFARAEVVVPPHAVDGLNLIWFSDLVVSGGGTMNREAAALGVPVYSIFRGEIGAVDRSLAREGRLVLVTTPDEVQDTIELTRRRKNRPPDGAPRPALLDIVANLETIMAAERSNRS
jgi:predicted glycosyltransferase